MNRRHKHSRNYGFHNAHAAVCLHASSPHGEATTHAARGAAFFTRQPVNRIIIIITEQPYELSLLFDSLYSGRASSTSGQQAQDEGQAFVWG